ncbi:SH3 and multiple ankyrin repeat domains protein 2 [Varanus komodoensis]|nr:SH3 and multiple ankyrin repeat domains protein 2 [Varanus komodoensis]
MMMNLHTGGAATTVVMKGCNNGRYPRNSLYSDCIIEEKAVVLQKKDNEGFGFVLRGAKADTPIEEFTPTPAFPALQYLESVDEGGVAWQAGLRTGDFLIEECFSSRPNWVTNRNFGKILPPFANSASDDNHDSDHIPTPNNNLPPTHLKGEP